ncbi:hypothetical protein [Leucobacter sp. USHLN153]|uniref:hypothetical protein n=1 Tax=Leucobacter sp. USHLN153 TaxID=3081268 RepID=UPI003015B649
MTHSEDRAEARRPVPSAPPRPAGRASVHADGADHRGDAPEARAGAPEGRRDAAEERVLEDGLLNRIDVIESQPLEQRAAFFEQVHDELLAELQRGDRGGA